MTGCGMRMLNDKEIIERIHKGDLKIDPLNVEAQVQPASVDLQLGGYIMEVDAHERIDTKHMKDKIRPSWLITKGEPLILAPDDFILANTMQYVEIPSNMAGMCTGRSSIGRLGISIHVTAGFIDPGFKGTITLEIKNISKNTVILYPRQRIAQLLLFEINEPEYTYATKKGSGKYMGQKLPRYSRINEDEM